jgi:branched-chain amino acid transport system permease protein
MKNHPRATFLSLLAIALVFLPQYASSNYLNFATDALIASLLAISLNLLVGYGGMVSFGHAAYFGVGAYACGLLMKQADLPFSLALIAASSMAVVVALFAGYFCVQLTKVYFSILTLAFSQIVWAICFRWNDLTGGDQGLSGIPYPDFSLFKKLPGLAAASDTQLFYYVVLVIVTVCTGFAFLIVRSPFGRCLVAARENPQRCTFIGLNVHTIQLTAFCLAAALAGIAGGLFGINNRGVYPDFLFYTKGAEILIMVLLGGSGTFWGPAIGATVLLWLHQETGAITEYWGAILGLILAILTLALPDGLAGIGTMIKRKLSRKASHAALERSTQ